jgi:hypothetical protein|tara:strand:- start:143 stop:325 length:183 start_codon:yes stop_codon:yes gene_type:complete
MVVVVEMEIQVIQGILETLVVLEVVVLVEMVVEEETEVMMNLQGMVVEEEILEEILETEE